MCITDKSKSSNRISLTFAFVVVGLFAPDEERLVLLKLVVQFYFTYDVSRGYLYIYLWEVINLRHK